MATTTVITFVCDLCGTDENVESHVLSLDQKTPRVVDACPGCWTPVADVLENVMRAGTSKKIADRRVAASRTTRATVSAPTSSKNAAQKKGPQNTGPKSAPEKKASSKTGKAAKKTTSRAPRKAPA